MTEQPLLPSPDEAPEPVFQAPKAQRRDLFPWLYGLGFLVLAAAVFYLWQYPGNEPGPDTVTLQAVEQRLIGLDARLAALEQRPPPDIASLAARLDAIDGRVADQTKLVSRVDTISGRIESLSGRDQTSLDATKQQLDSLAGRISAVAANAGNLDAVTKRLNQLDRLQQASLALAAGRPVGDLPNAPPALARYAHAAPPTEAQLRLRFPRDQQAALAAKQPDLKDAPFVDRVWDRAQGLITVRRGDEIVIGDASATILNQARVALDAGDVTGAVSFIETLKGPPGRAMAGWLADAKALLGARAALADMADQA